ncbi:MAG: hypothetical protein JST68_14140 [Bacteroidetes bacterium]|nr:hypothetical protein [Bacteroidota bacterium]
MKKLLYSSVVLLILFTACKKSNVDDPSSGPITVSAKINGKLTTFSAITVDTTGGEIDIMAGTDSLHSFPAIQLFLTTNGPLKPGVYPSQALVNPSAPNSYLNYIVPAGGGSFATVMYASYNDSIIVSSVTSKGVSGTFYGTVDNHYLDFQTLAYKDSLIYVTEGTFNVKF